jgi:hypothetical protein
MMLGSRKAGMSRSRGTEKFSEFLRGKSKDVPASQLSSLQAFKPSSIKHFYLPDGIYSQWSIG